MNKKPQNKITRPLDEIVRPVIKSKCTMCCSTIGALDGSVLMKTGIHCIPCAETLGAFDRFQDDD